MNAELEDFSPEVWATLLSEHGSWYGHVDIALLGDDPAHVRATSFTLLAHSLSSPEFRSVLIVTPPTWTGGRTIAERARAILVANGHADAAARVTQHELQTLDASIVVELTRESKDGALIYVAAAADYRHPELTSATGFTAAEDVWVPHLVRLAADLGAIVAGTSSYVVLDGGHFPPVAASNQALLENAPGNVIATTVPEGVKRIAAAIVNAHAGDPSSMGDALSAIAAAEHLDPKVHALLQATTLHGGGRYVGAFGALAPFWDEWLQTGDSGVLVELARIAGDAGDSAKAESALRQLDLEHISADLLEIALHAASRTDSDDLEDRFLQHLRALRPRSELVPSHLINRAIREHDWASLRNHAGNEQLAIDADERTFLIDLCAAIEAADDVWNETALALAKQYEERAGWVRTLLGREAKRRGRYPEAVHQFIGVPLGDKHGPRAASLAIDTLESVLLQRTENGEFVIPDVILAQTVAFIASQAARAPRDTKLRTKLAELLSAGILGMRGEALLIYLIENLATDADREPPLIVGDATIDEAHEFVNIVATIAKSADPAKAIITGVGSLPPSITVEKASRLLPILPKTMSHILAELETERDTAFARLLLHAALLTSERAGARRIGLMLLRQTAVHFATAGWSQDARDTVEHGLALVEETPADLRLAWAAFADVYHRLGNLQESLVAMLFALAFPTAKLRAEEAWQEIFLLVRLMRDIGMHDGALTMLGRAEKILSMTDVQIARLESIKLTVELRRHDIEDRNAPDPVLMERLAANIQRLIDLDDDVVPPLALLVQLVARASAGGVDSSPALHELISDALARTSPTIRARLEALGAQRPDLETVRRLASRVGAVRFGEDVGYDILAPALVAQRALVRAESLDGWTVCELIETLTDKTLVTGSGNADPTAVRRGISYLLERGHAVHMLGVDDTGTLVRATIREDNLPVVVREARAVFDSSAFQEWKKTYPFQYCFMDDSMSVMSDLVRHSVDHFGISATVADRSVIVPDVRISSFPMNLLRHGTDFLGELHPTSTSPSLAWLAQLGSTARVPTNRRVAWISDGVPEIGDSTALGLLAERLEPTLAEHGFAFSRSKSIPGELAGADIAIVGAHGGLLPDARFFQVIRDEANARWSARSIAEALTGAAVAVLFVCSSGRFDQHPRARASLGLPKLLLEAGVRAVVGSPWPLDTKVPPQWLPIFLAKLSDSCVGDAAFAANLAVSRAFGGNPPYTFAMHVYGDPTHRLGA